MKKVIIIDLFAVFLLAIFLTLFFFPVLFQNKTFVTTGVVLSDHYNQNYPYKVVYAEKLKQGGLPFWVANMGDGFPLVAEGQVGAFYPLNLLLFKFLPTLTAFNLSLALHYFLAFLFTYLFSRYHLKLSSFSSFLAGLTFTFSGFMITHLVHLSMIQTVCFLPIQIWLIDHVLIKPRWRQVIPLTLIFTLQFLAGHAEVFAFSSLFLGGWVVIRLFLSKQKEVKKGFYSVIIFIISAILTLLFCLPQIYATWQFVGVSNRAGGFSFEESVKMTFSLKHLLTFLLPMLFDFTKEGFFGPEITSVPLSVFNGPKAYLWEAYFYLGILPLLLALSTVVRVKKDNRVKFFLTMSLIALFLALGELTPLYKILWAVVPGFKLFKYPTRFMVFNQFGLAVLAGLGTESLMEKISNYKFLISKKLIVMGLIFIVMVDLYVIQKRVNPIDSAKDWFSPPESAIFLRKNLGFYRFHTLGTANLDYLTTKDLPVQKELRNLLQGGSNLLFNLASTTEQSAILLDRYVRLLHQTPDIRLKYDEKKVLIVPDNFVKMISLKSAKFVLSGLPLKNKNLILREEILLNKEGTYMIPQIKEDMVEILRLPVQKVYIYENLKVLPRAYLVYKVKDLSQSEEGEVLESLVEENFEPQKEVILEERLPVFLNEEGMGKVEITDSQDEKVTLRFESSGDGLLVLTDNFYPGWQVFIDGQKTKIYLANFAFRAVPITKGKHEVEFKYQPFGFLK